MLFAAGYSLIQELDCRRNSLNLRASYLAFNWWLNVQRGNYRPCFTSGIYKEGETDLENFAVEVGYMLLPAQLELVAGYEAQDADEFFLQMQ